MLNDLLKKLGFGDKEIEVYLTVLKHGKILPADVAKLTKLNRSTVYSVAGDLIKQGVLTEDLGGSVRYLLALPPEDLMRLAETEEKKLEGKKKLIQETIGELKSFASEAVYSLPKITFIAEEEIERHLHKRSAAWTESMIKVDGIWWGFQDHSFVTYYMPWIEWYWKTAPPGVSLKLFSNPSDVERVMKEKNIQRREIRFWKEARDFTTSLWAIGDYVVMIMTNNRPFYLVEIHDAALSHNLREMFKGIWKGVG